MSPKEKEVSLVDRIRNRLNENAGREMARSFLSKDDLLQVKGWIPLKPFFEKGTGGAKGFPCGHITQLIGETDSGKSTAMMEGMISCQNLGGIAYLIDAEHKWSMERFALMGGKPEDVVVLQPQNLEEAWECVSSVLKEIKTLREEGVTVPMMLGWDSLPASTPQKIIEGEAGSAYVSVEARINNQEIRKLRSLITDTNTAFVLTNHYYYTVPKTPYEQPKLVIKGGSEITFLSLLIIKTQQGQKLTRVIKGETQQIGRITKYVIHKGHFSGRSITQDVWVVDRGIIETKEEFAEYQKTLKGDF